MFLKRVYRYNKKMFGAILFFMLLQLICFYKKGMVFSPWFNYGMYSEPIHPESHYEITKVYAGYQLLKGNEFSPQQWDRIHFNLQQAAAAGCNGNFYNTQVKRIYQKFRLPVPDPSKFVNAYDRVEMQAMNAQQLSDWLKSRPVQVFPLEYIWDDKIFIFRDSLYTITSNSFLCQ